VVFPILKSLAKSFGSDPEEGTSSKMGTFLTLVIFQVTGITSAMFLTAMAGNPLIVHFAAEAGVEISWGKWLLASIVPGIVSLLFIPWLIYKLSPPDIKETPHAHAFAGQKLKEMGKVSKHEWMMIGTFALLLTLWIVGPIWGINAAETALLGLAILLVLGVLSWRDVLHEEGAWDIFVWFAVLVVMASNLNKLGLTKWFSAWVVGHVAGLDWMVAFGILSLLYFYSHYFFASNVAHIGAMFPPFALVAIAVGTPPLLAICVLAFFSSLFGGLTHYGCSPAPILYAAGYVPITKWWRIGGLVSVVNIVIWIVVGGFWWKWLGFW
jgi:DASS family divalent anion:Na+ symporter